MYLDAAQSVSLAEQLVERKIASSDNLEIAVFPSALALIDVRRILGDHCSVGAQNCSYTPSGAYTGAISAPMFRSAGCTYVLVGHSERRHVFGETDTSIQKKMAAALDAGLVPVLCIGETKEEKDAGKREYRLKKQLFSALGGLDLSSRRMMIAYEPVWAIGTGDACLPADADDAHGWIREEVLSLIGSSVPILYGGSVDRKNAAEYVALETADGVLVGSASTADDSFATIVAALS